MKLPAANPETSDQALASAEVEQRLAKKAQNITWGFLGTIVALLIFMLLLGLGGYCTGPEGEIGTTGPQGVVGPAGPQGESGVVTGPAGPVGGTGPGGPEGPEGPSGPIGEPGPEGEVGLVGPSGEQGEFGLQGEVGPIGQQGIQGETGIEGPPGELAFIMPAPASLERPNVNHLLFFQTQGILMENIASVEVPNRASRRNIDLATKQAIRVQWAHHLTGAWPKLSIEFYRASANKWITLIPMFGESLDPFSNQTSQWVGIPRYEPAGDFLVRAVVHGGPDASSPRIIYVELDAR